MLRSTATSILPALAPGGVGPVVRVDDRRDEAMADDVRDVYAEAKANGYDTKTMRKIVALRKMETHARQEADALMETYRTALGLA